MKFEKLDAQRFDAMALGVVAPAKVKPWGAKAIAKYLGSSEASVRRWAEESEVPINKPGGRYFAFRHELDIWLRTKP